VRLFQHCEAVGRVTALPLSMADGSSEVSFYLRINSAMIAAIHIRMPAPAKYLAKASFHVPSQTEATTITMIMSVAMTAATIGRVGMLRQIMLDI